MSTASGVIVKVPPAVREPSPVSWVGLKLVPSANKMKPPVLVPMMMSSPVTEISPSKIAMVPATWSCA
ncbi:hypothetical protein D3C83_175250 [compost metagenome]